MSRYVAELDISDFKQNHKKQSYLFGVFVFILLIVSCRTINIIIELPIPEPGVDIAKMDISYDIIAIGVLTKKPNL